MLCVWRSVVACTLHERTPCTTSWQLVFRVAVSPSNGFTVRRAQQRLAATEENGGVKRTASLKPPAEDAEPDSVTASQDAHCKRQKLETDWLRQVGQSVLATVCVDLSARHTVQYLLSGRRRAKLHLHGCDVNSRY